MRTVKGAEGATGAATRGRDLVFSPDGRSLAYAAERGDKEFVVVDGVEGREYDTILAGRNRVEVLNVVGGPIPTGSVLPESRLAFVGPRRLRALAVREAEVLRVEVQIAEP